MDTKAEATIEDLYGVEGKAELIDGEIVRMSPAGGRHNRAAFRIAMSLYDYERRTGRGHAIGENAGFVVDLPGRELFSPDAAFYVGELTDEFLRGAPVFAVEVRSPGDYSRSAERLLANKRADYFTAGTQVVWDVDLLSEHVVRVYRAGNPEQPSVYRRGELAEAEPALPGWTMPVDDLFPAG